MRKIPLKRRFVIKKAMGLAALTLCLSGYSVAAQTACPTARDLSDGVRFDMAGGASWTIRSAGGRDRQVSFVWDPNFSTQTMMFHDGAYLTRIAAGDFSQTLTYDPSVRRAPSPASGTQWSAVMRSDAPDSPPITSDFHFAAQQTVRFGSCDYAMVPVTQLQSAPDSRVSTWSYQYYPEFGAVVIVSDGFGTTWTITGIVAQ